MPNSWRPWADRGMAHSYTAVVHWARGDDAFAGQRYSRAHLWSFDGGTEVPASASPLHVRAPFSRADAVDPEEAFVAALSSCHMLFFLNFAAAGGYVVDSYRDEAVGRMGRDAAGAEFIETVTLDPAVGFSGDRLPDAAAMADLHHRSHAACYLANSVRSEVVVAGLSRHVA